MKYEILRFEMIPTANLTPHPDAQAYPSDEDDRCALDASIEGVGVLEPLTVIESANEFLVIDGCGRLEDAERSGTKELPCLVVTCDNPREFAAHKNAMGRKRSTGSRVLCYLMANSSIVLETCRTVQSHDRTGKIADLPIRLQPWTSREIAKRLHVSDKDVLCAIQLMACQTGGVDPKEKDLSEADRAKMETIFNGVMCARTPVRRWKAAFAGSTCTADLAKAPVNHADLGIRTMKSVKTVFEGWQSVSMIARDTILNLLDSALDSAPEDVEAMLVKRYGQTDKTGRKAK